MADLGFKTDLNRFWTNSASSFAQVSPFGNSWRKSALEYFAQHCVLTYLDYSQTYFMRSLNARIESGENWTPAQNEEDLTG